MFLLQVGALALNTSNKISWPIESRTTLENGVELKPHDESKWPQESERIRKYPPAKPTTGDGRLLRMLRSKRASPHENEIEPQL